jgi:hypothetical protein
MGYTYEELRKKTVAELREIAEGIEDEAVRGYRTMHKHELLPAICKALGIEAHEHHVAVGIDKTKIKVQIRRLKKVRDEALAAGDDERLRDSRHRIKRLKRKLRRAIV